MDESDNEAPKDPGVRQQRYTEQDYEGKIASTSIIFIVNNFIASIFH